MPFGRLSHTIASAIRSIIPWPGGGSSAAESGQSDLATIIPFAVLPQAALLWRQSYPPVQQFCPEHAVVLPQAVRLHSAVRRPMALPHHSFERSIPRFPLLERARVVANKTQEREKRRAPWPTKRKLSMSRKGMPELTGTYADLLGWALRWVN